jgi:hypothetical protein
LRKSVRRAEVDDGRRPGLTSGEHAEIKRLKRENLGRGAVAREVFGQARVDHAVDQITAVLQGWGRRSPQVTTRSASLVSHVILLNRITPSAAA